MTVAEQNLIRFNFPAVYETNFALNLNPRGDADAKTLAKAAKDVEKGIQYSIVWDHPEAEEIAVFCGVGDLEMAGWKLNFAGKTSRDDLAKHIVAKIKTPEEFYLPFPARYRKPVEEKPTAAKGGAAASQSAAGSGKTSSKEKK